MFNLGNIGIPQWLAQATGANAHALNFANDFKPTLGDALQGIGSSMKSHYLQGQGGQGQGQGAAGGNPLQGSLLGTILSGLGGQGVPPQGAEQTPALPPAQAVDPRRIQGSPLAPVGNWTGPFDPRAQLREASSFANILKGLG